MKNESYNRRCGPHTREHAIIETALIKLHDETEATQKYIEEPWLLLQDAWNNLPLPRHFLQSEDAFKSSAWSSLCLSGNLH